MSVTSGLHVHRGAPQLLVQDLGRPGWAHVGVPPSGALDPAALTLANRLVGNPEAAAGIEILLGGCVFVPDVSVRIALTGAQLPLTVDGVLRPWGASVSVRGGQVIEVGVSGSGLRSWLAVAGGIASPLTLDSRSTDTLTGLGPEAVRAGDTLPIARTTGAPGQGEAVPAPRRPGPTRLRIRLGPRDGEFSDGALEALRTCEYVVSADSDRVGVRLHHPDGGRLSRRAATELESEGIVTGAVQVPAGGEPLIFLADHPVTGGYPVIAVVDGPDLASCAQLRPGDRVTFAESSAH